MESLEAAARSRSEADWVVGMNATRAASIRLRSAFDGAVSLGRVQTPTLALVARREEEIRAFKPEPYWLVEAGFEADPAAPLPRPLHGRQADRRGRGREDRRARSRAAPATITKLEKKEEREKPQLLYDLTSLQRHANTLFGFSARRTLGAAQSLYEEYKAITYPRTNSRFLPSDQIAEIKPTAELVGHNAPTGAARRVRHVARQAAARPRDQRREGRGPPRDHPDQLRARPRADGLGREAQIYDLVAKRFLAIFHPDAVFERTRVETTVAEHVFRTSGRRLLEAGWKAVYGAEVDGPEGGEDDTGGDQMLPQASSRASPWTSRTSSRSARRRSRRGASPRRRCWARWRPPARRSTTPSCARP